MLIDALLTCAFALILATGRAPVLSFLIAAVLAVRVLPSPHGMLIGGVIVLFASAIAKSRRPSDGR